MPKIPWQKVKELAIDLTGQLWNEEEKEIRRIIDAAPADEKVITVSFSHVIDCNGETPSIKTKIGFSEKFSATKTASVDDPAQMKLGEKSEEEPAGKA